MATSDANSMPLEDCPHRISNTTKHSNHRTRRRKHFPLATMPHCHRGKRKLHLDLDFEWDSTDTTPWVDGASDDYSSLESNPHLSEPSHVTFSGLRTLCEDFSFSLDSLNDNLVAQPSSPPLANVTPLHCPFASSSHESLPSVNIRERNLNQKLSRMNLSDYESDIEEEESYGYEEEIPLIIESDCEGDEDSLQEFASCFKNPCATFNHLPGTSPSDIPFKKVTSVSTVSASNSYDSIPTTSSNESLRTVSTSPTRSTSSELFPCPENYDMLYRNFEIAAKMEENKNLMYDDKDHSDTVSSVLSSNSSSGSNTSKIDRENSNLFPTTRCHTSLPGNSVTTFALLADSKRKSPHGNREIISNSLQEKSVTHWTEVLSKQCHSSKSSPESGINSPVDQSPDSPKAQRPHFLPLQLRHVQRPAVKPNKTPLPGQRLSIEGNAPNLLRTLSAPGGFENSSKSNFPIVSAVRDSALLEPESTSTIPEVEETITPENGNLISWTQGIKNPLRSFSVNEKCTTHAPLIDWEDIFTSRQSFCEMESLDASRECLPLSSNRGDENANYSCCNRAERFTGRTGPKNVVDKGIMTSPPLLNMDCYRTTSVHNHLTSVPVYTPAGNLSRPTVYSLPPQSLEDFSDDSSLSSLESLEMDDSVFRESLYSLSSEHLYQSQTFTPVPDEVYEDSLCEDLPRNHSYDSELKEGVENQLQYINSVLPTCFVDGTPPSKELMNSNSRANILLNQDKRSSSFESDSTVKQLTPSHGTLEDDRQYQKTGTVYDIEETLAKDDAPVRYVKHKPLKPIHQVDREYRCRKALEQLTRPSHAYSTPSIYHNSRPQTIVISTNSTLGHPIVSAKVSQDEESQQDWHDDLLDSLPPQEMRVSPKSEDKQSKEMELYGEKRDLVLSLKSAIQVVQQHCGDVRDKTNRSKHDDGNGVPDINQLVLTHICPAVKALVKDGMKSFSHGWLVGRVKNTPWIIIQATTQLGPGTRALNDLYNAICTSGMQSNHSVRFHAFVMGLLNNKLLPDWLEHCYNHPNIIRKYYESSAFWNLCNSEPYTELFQELLVAVRHLSKLTFHLDYFYETKLLMVEKHGSEARKEEEKLEGSIKGGLSLLVGQGKGSQRDGNSSQEEEPRRLTTSVWNFVGKMKNYATQSSTDQNRVIDESRSDNALSPGRGEGEGEPAENMKECNLDQSILSDGSSETGWSMSWIRGFANTVPSSKENQGTSSGSSSQNPSAKTWGEVFKSSKWQKFGSGLSQMVPKVKWKDTKGAGETPSYETMPVPPLYERHISGSAGSPSPGEIDSAGLKGSEVGTFSRIRTQVKTRCHYVSLNQGELSFMKGDILTVNGQPSDEWLLCAQGSESGLVHVDYIQEVD